MLSLFLAMLAMSAMGFAGTGFSLSTATHALSKGAENLLTEMLAKVGGKGAASLTFRLLADQARNDPKLAKRIFDLIVASENAATFAAGAVEGLLPAIEKMEGQMGNMARIARSFFVNLFERTFPRYFDELKVFADAGDFEGFQSMLDQMVSETGQSMSIDTDQVLAVKDGKYWIAFKGEDDPNFIDWKTQKESGGDTVQFINPPKAGGTVQLTQVSVPPGRLVMVKMTLDEALRNQLVMFDPQSFPNMTWGFTGGAFARKSSALSRLTTKNAWLVGIAVSAAIKEAMDEGRHITLRDEWEQAQRNCTETRPFEGIAASVELDASGDPIKDASGNYKVNTAMVKTWLLYAGSHASMEMQAFQQINNLLDGVLTDAKKLRKLARKGLKTARKFEKKHRIVKRTWWHGKVSAIVYIIHWVVWLVATIAPETSHTPWVYRLIGLFVSLGMSVYFILWLLITGWFIGFGRDLFDSGKEILGSIANRFGFKEDLEIGPTQFFGRSLFLYGIGLTLGAFESVAFALSLLLLGEEAVKHLHNLSFILSLSLVALLVIVIGAELYLQSVKRAFWDAMREVRKDIKGAILFFRIIKSKPAIGLVILLPIALGYFIVVDLPKIGQVDDVAVLYTNSEELRLDGNEFVSPRKALGGDVEFVRPCSIGGVAHAAPMVNNLPVYHVPGGDELESEWFEFKIDRISRVVYASRSWKQLVRATHNISTGRSTVTLRNGDRTFLKASFPGASVPDKKSGLVEVDLDLWPGYFHESEGATFEVVPIGDNKGWVMAQKKSGDITQIGAGTLNAIWDWLDAKAWWAYVLLMCGLFVAGFISLFFNKYVGATVFALGILSMLLAFAT